MIEAFQFKHCDQSNRRSALKKGKFLAVLAKKIYKSKPFRQAQGPELVEGQR
jgi:hypothetical protein